MASRLEVRPYLEREPAEHQIRVVTDLAQTFTRRDYTSWNDVFGQSDRRLLLTVGVGKLRRERLRVFQRDLEQLKQNGTNSIEVLPPDYPVASRGRRVIFIGACPFAFLDPDVDYVMDQLLRNGQISDNMLNRGYKPVSVERLNEEINFLKSLNTNLSLERDDRGVLRLEKDATPMWTARFLLAGQRLRVVS